MAKATLIAAAPSTARTAPPIEMGVPIPATARPAPKTAAPRPIRNMLGFTPPLTSSISATVSYHTPFLDIKKRKVNGEKFTINSLFSPWRFVKHFYENKK